MVIFKKHFPDSHKIKNEILTVEAKKIMSTKRENKMVLLKDQTFFHIELFSKRISASVVKIVRVKVESP